MVFDDQKQRRCNKVERQLQKVNLLTRQEPSRDKDEIFLFITATPETFEIVAEKLALKKEIKGIHEKTVLVDFTLKKKESFIGYSCSRSFWTSYERSEIILHLIQATRARGGAFVDVASLIARKEMMMCFPLHDLEKKDELLRTWVKRPWTQSLSQPLDQIRGYFGEYIAIYFAWLEHYTRWLVFPAIIGLLGGILGFIIGFDNYFVPFYAIFIALWATLYLEYWKRSNSVLINTWDIKGVNSQERVRPAFMGERRYGVYVNGIFVQLRPGISLKTPKVTWAPTMTKYYKYSFGFTILLTFLGVVIVTTLSFVTFKLFIEAYILYWNAVVGGILNAIAIMLFNFMYGWIASKLTEWENHRTEEEWETSFVVKNFLFQFVNSYVSLFYTAFIKGRFPLFGLTDARYNTTCHPNCLTEVTVLMATLFLTNIFVGQAQEVLIPWVKAKLCIYVEDRSLRKQKETLEASQADIESKLTTYPSAFDDYNEMAIQFGYVTLFAAAFPFAPMAALINNLVELRTDALKLLTGMQRPHPRCAHDIGIWFEILEIINYAAVITNTGLIFITSGIFHESSSWGHFSAVELFIMAIVAEHVILVLKWTVARIIPDTPYWVLQNRAKREYNKQKLLEELAAKDPENSAFDIYSNNIDEGYPSSDDEDEESDRHDHVIHLEV
eukprot:TRINITY_DN5054_c0_g1_i1.p1 TRINITY_DN5054_c0_g1~~TRINITY_DN5054_c0_g1_i1.p1  ORF type:complete len:718 (+),score=198.14 TRINITY_DN5054_c0_g1_i1:149-2155(+)